MVDHPQSPFQEIDPTDAEVVLRCALAEGREAAEARFLTALGLAGAAQAKVPDEQADLIERQQTVFVSVILVKGNLDVVPLFLVDRKEGMSPLPHFFPGRPTRPFQLLPAALVLVADIEPHQAPSLGFVRLRGGGGLLGNEEGHQHHLRVREDVAASAGEDPPIQGDLLIDLLLIRLPEVDALHGAAIRRLRAHGRHMPRRRTPLLVVSLSLLLVFRLVGVVDPRERRLRKARRGASSGLFEAAPHRPRKDSRSRECACESPRSLCLFRGQHDDRRQKHRYRSAAFRRCRR
mmetsp:Transcript_77481/g.250766  ORF Transcript_77481/g.250766 Transcript_77481/m.250766 type:complete len:291 (+) Transcript_77481:1910-2782(+)